jgi:hypothetical protein
MPVINESQIKAKPAEIKEFFEKDSIRGKVTLTDLKNLKADGGKDYDDIAFGIGNDSLTY